MAKGKREEKKAFETGRTKQGTTNAQSKLDAERNLNTKILQGANVPCQYCRNIDNMILMQASLCEGRVSRLDRPG
ncbi:hypothetical protein N7463_007689 [Penicillium fimorum]|uniref:Uncharacterized protein n=1 Tax=Penicillium fimorum TaxID=1882269 RepID=A0A9X0C7U8_9EURO|nr:hypothetical protein N7463_007689 [Penicillium fimorum]